ncbi:hypothetical protein CONPUDRAFT_164405 [Coniophora puteana RWD-64-598 SS2]|uniref:Uncharacterized protein n=1 Tax=Coniophora puteana (strain RWD-64-598) TaxID=741705 RepID=A0A5M3MXG4_CONPW|nr:uncharacterized protein CONPUDRAFT_164405 [Coniophora puteana RWD-64-598 SS2]EIW83464.1 hypothetical protein CONPUDRAFT_164405 [Coniophora puteana RWD-64-598 SS2]
MTSNVRRRPGPQASLDLRTPTFHHDPSSPSISPAQAIADAWSHEPPESQEYWRAAEARRREQYLAARPRPRLANKM